MKRYGITDVKKIIESKNGTLLSEKYENTHSRITIKCNKCNWVWTTRFANITKTNGTWCQKCVGKVKYSISDIEQVVNKRGGTLLSKKYKNTHSKITIRCNKCNWVWSPKVSHIVRPNGSWCPSCAGNSRPTLNHIKKEIKSRGGKLVSQEYKNQKMPLDIICNKCNNGWTTSFDNIKNGKHWCPSCSIGKSQRLLTNIIKDIYKDYSVSKNYKGFAWLKNKKDPRGVLEIDIFVKNKDKSFSLAIEYNGRQHYMPVCFGGMSEDKAEKEFKLTKKRDKRKRYLLKKHQEDVKYFVIFNYKEQLTKEYVINKLIKKGVLIESVSRPS